MAASQDNRAIGEHDWHSADYVDWWIARDRDRDAERRARLRAMLAHAGVPPDATVSVIDIGGGYGVVSEEVLAALPRARVTLQDYSEPMLDEARRRLARYADRTDFVQVDLTDPTWVGKVGGPFDLAVSAIVIHNLRELDRIAACYHGIAQVLKPGGRFLDYDLFFERIGGLAHHTELLREAGFATVERLWEAPPLATIAAQTPPA